MSIFKLFKKALLGWIDADFLKDNLIELNNTNYGLLRTACLFSTVMCLFLYVLTQINPLIYELNHFYLSYFLFFAILYLFVLMFVNLHRRLVPFFFYIFAAAVFALVIYVGTWITPNLPAVTFYVFLMIIPILFVTRPIYAVLLSVLACAVFCIATIYVKGAESYLAHTDVLNAVCCCIIGIGFDITIINLHLDIIRSKSQFKRQSTTDELTELPNRRSFDLYGEMIFHKKLLKNDNIFIFMMDIDEFKSYNDTYGHVKGDDCLYRVSRALERTAKIHNVFLARFGGEEFVAVFIPQTRDEVHKIADRFVECISELALAHKGSSREFLTISLGYAGHRDCCSQNYHHLLDCADSALYLAKSRGKNQACIWKPSDCDIKEGYFMN